MPVSPFKLSTTVTGAVQRLEKAGPVSAIELAKEILKSHTRDYAKPKGTLILQFLNNAIAQLPPHTDKSTLPAAEGQGTNYTSRQWVEAVGNLYNESIITELHGRIFLIGLSLLDKSVRTILQQDSFLATLITEVQDIVASLSPPGLQLYHVILEPPATTLENPNLPEATTFLGSFDHAIYFVNSFWHDEDQSARFFKEDTWQPEAEDTTGFYFLAQVRQNDIFINKSQSNSNQPSLLTINAIGVVVATATDNRSVTIDWKVSNLSIVIENVAAYTSTISRANNIDVSSILSQLDRNLWEKYFPSGQEVRHSNIAGLISDSDKGVDYLDISKDVTAFARVIAAKSFEPPLAVALFGKWGSGKSFFINKLKTQIIAFSDQGTPGIYCPGIAHIHFNAWSYMDANLWASMVTKIFEGLNEYISENSKGQEEKRAIEKQLSQQLSITKEEMTVLEIKKKSVSNQIRNLEDRRNAIKVGLQEKIATIRDNSLWKAIENADRQFNAQGKIREAFEQNETFVQSAEELRAIRAIVPEKYWDNPEAAYHQAKSKYTFLKEFFNRKKIQGNLIWLAIFLLAIFITPLILEAISNRISNMNFLLPQAGLSLLVLAGSIWKRGEVVYKRLQPLVASFWQIKENYEKDIKEAVSKFEQEEKALKLEIEKRKSEILLVDGQIQQAQSIQTDIEFKINHALATEALYSFIDKRSKSEDYQKYLGIISIIRKDFETLSDLFVYHHQEVDKIRKAEEFKDKFKKPLERIILYIDDLDRCPEENVVQVLEAVNLLMAFRLFVVIVGVDPRWIKNALIKKHSQQFSDTDPRLEPMEPSTYLEKIFQIPFHLKDATDISVKDMIRQLAQTRSPIDPTLPESDPAIPKSIIQTTIDIPIQSLPIKAIGEGQMDPVKEQDLPYLLDQPEALVLTENEIGLMQDMSEVIGNNPRAIKRFVNIFRIIKAHEDFNYEKENENGELLVILLLIALPLGKYRKLIPSFEAFIQDESNIGSKLYEFLQLNNPVGDLGQLRHQLNVLLSDKPNYFLLQNSLNSSFNKHNGFIKRFSFNDL